MRKIIAGFMATAMLTSVCATMSFATNKAASVDAAALTDDVSSTVPASAAGIRATVNSEDVSYSASFSKEYAVSTTAADLGASLNGVVIPNIVIDNKRFDLKLTAKNATVRGTLSPEAEIPENTTITVDVLDSNGRVLAVDTGKNFTLTFSFGTANNGEGGLTADIEASGTLDKLNIDDVIECDGQGNPIPLTESAVGVDKNQNGQQGVQSNNTLYFMVKKGEFSYDNEDYWKMKISKGNNAKLVKAVSDVSKNFSNNLYNAVNGAEVSNTSGRHRFVKVELNELYTDDEYKVALDLRLSAKSGANRVFGVQEDSEIKVNDFTFYVKNLVKTADNDWKVGVNGLMLNPLENDWNEVTYFDEDSDVAFMKFFGDSDIGKFYAKLSTKWEHADYAAYFNDQEAFYFEFTGSPKLSSTSRADLQIYDPFLDEDGNAIFDASTATIYQVIDGDLIDVTESFTYGEGENGDNAFITRTRFLGSYIICEKPVEEAVADETVDELMPDANEVPTEVTPDAGNNNNNGGKAPANTGRYA